MKTEGTPIDAMEPASGKGFAHRLWLFTTQVAFTLSLVPLFLWPRLIAVRSVRLAIAHLIGRSWAGRYRSVIDFYGGAYGLPLASALERARELASVPVTTLADCGTGTRFAATEAALAHPEATVLACDRIFEMLRLPSYRPTPADRRIRKIRADSLRLPLADGSVEVAIAHNTTPFLGELARVCRPGGVVIFADSAARWIGPVARRAARRLGRFDVVEVATAGYGFYLIARRAEKSPGISPDSA